MNVDAWTGPVRPHLAGVAPYASARREGRDGLRLDANESGFGPVGTSGRIAGGELHRYPDPEGGPLRAALSTFLACDPDRLWLGSGADDAIDVLVRTLVDPGQAVVTTTPSYDLYRQRAAAHGADVRVVPLDEEFDLDAAGVTEAALGAPLVFVCSPNNPTGNLLATDRILAVLRRTGAVVAVDEAYVEFADGRSLADRAGLPGFERLVVIRTLSKAWGLAGLRTGYLVGAPPLVRLLDVVGLPYRLTDPAIRLGTRAVAAADLMRRRVRAIVAERERVAKALGRLGLACLPSDANFVLFFVPEAERVHARLAGSHGVVIRRRDGLPGLAGALRVTIGAPNENDRFLTALERSLG
ncbi:MAG: histidinol-phosphate transaminase [Gemmatimonadota bacterium]